LKIFYYILNGLMEILQNNKMLGIIFIFSYIEDWTKTDPNANPEESFESVFEKTFDSVRIDDKFCKTITNKKLYIYFVNSDDGKILHSFNMDYSSIINTNKFYYLNNNIISKMIKIK